MKSVSAQIPDSLLKLLDRKARAKGVTRSQLARDCLTGYFRQLAFTAKQGLERFREIIGE